ncbi:MAG: NAD(P)/FAD-dependent oxidoreductase [Rhodocyclaceae bacterium]|jgi:NADH dehydrogenase|nr:NAD(P)/FAD-dependent oxidoreductase [Rhodocyclaceae bacterium]MCA3134727.1 NAD(P)/FAD-dependent oxidoreductase [Rhodocyclaceae bacterium]MCA3141085.1 NAD(P)/FAD-dependent oxidoreductase [Rhodocyclaceae bacterium]MCA3146578.1 NAD(P)/FAD-dependent oxidoreductase [Rhodocyclaceae bacterium]MCE2898833.1 NAD(P)/FAD-dependent oxidoreductase [Betaproteobacteria bacterium]
MMAESGATGPHRILIAGGGAGGLELATRLGDKLGRRGLARITLIDRARTHLWKPLLHQVAAGSMDLNDHALDYLAQARWHGFEFQLGRMEGLDRAARRVWLAPLLDTESGAQVLPRRAIGYDTLVIAVGSHTNDFGTPGAAQHAIALDTPEQAERFRTRLLNACLRANAQDAALAPEQLHVAIIGAGATGVELSAELHNTTRELVAFGLDRIVPERDLKITLVEAAPRILPALPERLSAATEGLLRRLNVQVLTGERVTEVSAAGLRTASGREVRAELVVWAAGIKAPEFLAGLDGLETNRLNQLLVNPNLQVPGDARIFALGDCAACPWPEKNAWVPPRAQSAHQQASHLVKWLPRHLRGEPVPPWRYRDFGSLVSLGAYSTVGSLMGSISRGSLMIEGMFAGLMYKSLYKLHELALHGFVKVALDTVARTISRRTEPHVKLH